MGFSSPGFSHPLPWPTFQSASSRLSAPPLPQTVGLFPLWLSFLPEALSVVAKHRIFSQVLLLRVSTSKEFGLSLSRTADPPEVFWAFLFPFVRRQPGIGLARVRVASYYQRLSAPIHSMPRANFSPPFEIIHKPLYLNTNPSPRTVILSFLETRLFIS